MYKASVINDVIGPGYNKVGSAKTGACVDGAGIIDDDRPEGIESKVNIVAREKQADVNGEIYYAMHLSKNGTATMSNKTNKIFILINS